MLIDDIRVTIENGPLSVNDAAYYILQIKKASSKKFTLKKVTFSRFDTHLDIRYSFNEVPFERIRRIPFTDESEKRVVNR